MNNKLWFQEDLQKFLENELMRFKKKHDNLTVNELHGSSNETEIILFQTNLSWLVQGGSSSMRSELFIAAKQIFSSSHRLRSTQYIPVPRSEVFIIKIINTHKIILWSIHKMYKYHMQSLQHHHGYVDIINFLLFYI